MIRKALLAFLVATAVAVAVVLSFQLQVHLIRRWAGTDDLQAELRDHETRLQKIETHPVSTWVRKGTWYYPAEGMAEDSVRVQSISIGRGRGR